MLEERLERPVCIMVTSIEGYYLDFHSVVRTSDSLCAFHPSPNEYWFINVLTGTLLVPRWNELLSNVIIKRNNFHPGN